MKMNMFKMVGFLLGLSAFLSLNVYAEGENLQVLCTGACNLPVTYMKPKDGGAGAGNPVTNGISADTLND
jgi:hypothetical protein